MSSCSWRTQRSCATRVAPRRGALIISANSSRLRDFRRPAAGFRRRRRPSRGPRRSSGRRGEARPSNRRVACCLDMRRKQVEAPIECGEPQSAPGGRLPDLLRERLADFASRWPSVSSTIARSASIAGSSDLRRIVEGLLACGGNPSLRRKPARRLALDFDIERNGRIQLERQSIERHRRSLAQLKLKFANVLLRLFPQ